MTETKSMAARTTDRRTFILGTGAVTLLMLRGCGDDSATASNTPVVQAAPTPSPSAAPTAAPTPTVSASAVVVQAGDSIGYGGEAGGYAAIEHMDLPSVFVRNASVSGRTMATGFDRRGIDLFPLYRPDVPCILLIQQGTNDIDVDERLGTSLYYDVALPFIRAAKSAGLYVGLNTVLPRSDARWSAAKEKQRIMYNLLVRNNYAAADGINDVAADPQIGDGVDTANSAFYLDRLHLSLSGQQRMSVLDRSFVTGLLEKPPRSPV